MSERRFVRPGDIDSLPVVVVAGPEGAWTPGPCVQVEAGNVIELTADDLEWLLDVGPKALEALRAMETAA